MGMNPASLMKIMSAKSKFENGHPKFVAFFKTMISRGVEEGAVIEIKVTHVDGTETVGNMRVTAQDLEIMQDLKGIQP